MSAVPAETSLPLDEVIDAVAETLDVPPAEVDADIPLIALGLESFTAVRLRRLLLDSVGVPLALTDFLGQATARTIARALTAPSHDGDEPARHDATFPLTPIQTAYWVGRDPAFPLGGVATFYYREFEDTVPAAAPLDHVRELTRAWNVLVDRHDALRMVVDPDATGRVLAEVPHYELPVTDLRGLERDEATQVAEQLRADWSHQVRPADCWPLFDLHAVLLPGDRIRVCVGVDVLALDLAGWIQIMTEWGDLTADPAAAPAPPGATFAELARRRAARPESLRARDYWADRSLPPGPDLPTVTDPATLTAHRFSRHATELGADAWLTLKNQATRHGISPTALLLSAYALTLTSWGAAGEFCLNTTLFDRPDDSALAHVVGDFTSTVLVQIPRWDPVGRGGFSVYGQAVNQQFWADLDHRDVDGIQASRDHALTLGVPAHPVVFTSGLGLTPGETEPTAWLGQEVFGISQTPQVLLDHIVYEEAGHLRVCWDSVDDVYPDGLVTAMADAHLRLLNRLAEEPALWSDPTLNWNPSFTPDAELNVTPFPEAGPLLHDPLRAAALVHPEAPALLSRNAGVSHRGLTETADAIGRRLAAAGLGPGDLVAVAAPKGADQVIALLGVAASGAGYVPVEPGWPAGRIESICAQAGLDHALTTDDVDVQWPHNVRVHRMSDETGAVAAPHRPSPDDLAYVIFTSGSTGRPKGVAIEHRAARTTIDDLVDRFPLTSADRMLALSAFSFDLSVHDVFGVLGAGGALVLPDAEHQRDPGHWLELMAQHRVTLWNTAPALLEMLVEYAELDPALATRALRDLRLVFLSGDWIPVTLPDRLRELAPRAQVISLGGATEASIWSICHPIGDVDPRWRSIPYGRALRGQSFHILDTDGLPVPAGVPGQLHIGGGGLARGYIGDPQQSAQRFVHHPVLGRRLYLTGDLGRWQPDGTIEFLGRVDRQVKIRGHRIELGEIESVLDRARGVRKSVALSVPGPDDRPRLVAFLAPLAGTDLDLDEVTAQLRTRVPDYMVPSRFTLLAEFPVTTNGKIDYAALPNPYDRTAVPRAAPVSVAEPAETPPAGGDRNWLAASIEQAQALGLRVSLTVGQGSGDPSGTLTAAIDWSRRTRSVAGVALEEQLVGGGVLALAFPVHEAAVQTRPEAAVESVPAVTADPHPAAPSIELEETVLTVFRSLLGPDVDATTAFFALGASSLTLVLAHRQLAAQGFDTLTVVDLFAHPSVRELAAYLGRPVSPPDSPAPAVPAATTAPPDPPRGRREARLRAEQVNR